MRAYLRLLRFGGPHRWRFAAAILCMVVERLMQLEGGRHRTTLVIAHRLSTEADRRGEEA